MEDKAIEWDIKECVEFLKEESQKLEGKTLLISGAAGFLGHCGTCFSKK